MASNTILLESNRQSAYAQLEESRQAEKTNVFSADPPFPNHTWSTHISHGIRIDPGDRVSLEAGMINQAGGGSSVIEFTGYSGQTDGTQRISDNSTRVKLAYYVVNNQRFNFNLPKSRVQINYDHRKNAYGSPALYQGSMPGQLAIPTSQENFQTFERGYPYQFIEGSVTSFNNITKEWFTNAPDTITWPPESNLLPSFSKGGNSVNYTSSTKLYVGPEDYLGPFYIETVTPSHNTQPGRYIGQYEDNYDCPFSMEPYMMSSFWDYHSSEVLLSESPGFVNPSALASNLTTQLHQRDGTAQYWNADTGEEPHAMLLDINSVGVIGGAYPQFYKETRVPFITDATYKTFPTCTGKPLYQFLHGIDTGSYGGLASDFDKLHSWYGKFTGVNDMTALGDEFKPYQALAATYSYELTSRPLYMKAMSRLIQTIQRKPLNESTPVGGIPTDPDWVWWTTEFYLHTSKDYGGEPLSHQEYAGDMWDIGIFGNNVVLLDNLHHITGHNFPWYRSDRTHPNYNIAPVAADINLLDVQEGYIVGTNMIWNPDVLDLLGEIYSEYFEVIGNTINTDVNSDEFKNAHAIRLNIGRLNDQESIPAYKEDIIHTNPTTYPPIATLLWKSQYLACTYNIINYPDQGVQPIPGQGQLPFNEQPSPYRIIQITERVAGGVVLNSRRYSTLMGGFFGEENEILMKLMLPNNYTAKMAFDGELPNNGLSLGSLRTLTTSPEILERDGKPISFEEYKAVFWDKIPVLANGAKLGIVPLFFKTRALATQYVGNNGADCAYVGYIMKGMPVGKLQDLPCPSIGEYFGFSPSQLTTGAAQLATTQKILRNKIYPNPGQEGFDGILTMTIAPPPVTGWIVGDLGSIEQFPGGGTSGTGAQARVTQINNLPGTGYVVTLIEIVLQGSGYTVGQNYHMVGVGTDITVTIATVDANPGGGTDPLAEANVSPTIYYPYINVGAEDAAIVFDAQTSKFAIEQFHTPTTKGNGVFQRAAYPLNTLDPEQHTIEVNSRSGAICGTHSLHSANHVVSDLQFTATFYKDILAQVVAHPARSAQAGVSILDIQPVLNDGLPVKDEGTIVLTMDNTGLYKDTLLSKMGFIWEQLCPVYGQPSNDFNRGVYNEFLGFGGGINVFDKWKNMVRPFTTNAYIDATVSFSLSKLIGRTFDPEDETDTPIFELVPAFNLGGMADHDVGITNATSDKLVAEDLAQKLAFPYLVVYTNIINNVDYYGGPHGDSKLPAIAYITRNYSTGDFFFSTASDFSFIADSTYIITKIITDIRLPNGDPAPIDENSSIIYKVVKGKAMPPTEEEEEKAEEELKKKH